MDALKILESLLKNNATGSRRVEGLQQRGSGGMADILESILGGGGARRPPGGAPAPSGGRTDPRIRGFEGLIGGVSSGRSRPQPPPAPPEPQAQECAAIFISAMCHAAKVDGQLDAKEKDAIIGRLGEVTRDEIDFVNRELSSPLDLKRFCASVPPQLAPQVYGFSVMAITLDTLKEAAYLGRLAQGLGLDPATCNRIHRQVGAPEL